MTQNCKFITHLYFNYSYLTDSDIILIAKYYPKLKLFCVRSNHNVVLQESSFTQLFTSCTELAILATPIDANAIKDNTMSQIAIHCNNLRVLSLMSIHVNETNIMNIITNCKKLKYLELIGSHTLNTKVHEMLLAFELKRDGHSLLWVDIFEGVEPNWESLTFGIKFA